MTSGKAKPKAKGTSRASKRRKSATRSKSRAKRKGGKVPVVLLSGGNPQIAKAAGDAPLQAYIAAMPGWKRDLRKRLDALIVRTVPNVRKAVKWNSPLYGIEGQGWFLGWHVFTRYVKLAFFRGASLRPLPPGPSKDKNTRYLDELGLSKGVRECRTSAPVHEACPLLASSSSLAPPARERPPRSERSTLVASPG